MPMHAVNFNVCQGGRPNNHRNLVQVDAYIPPFPPFPPHSPAVAPSVFTKPSLLAPSACHVFSLHLGFGQSVVWTRKLAQQLRFAW